MSIDFYLPDHEVSVLTDQLEGLTGAARLPVLTAVVWHLRQRDTRQALRYADEAETLLAHTALAGETSRLYGARITLVRAEAAVLYGQYEQAQGLLATATAHFTELHDACGIGDVMICQAQLAIVEQRPGDSTSLLHAAREQYLQAADTLRAALAVAVAAVVAASTNPVEGRRRRALAEAQAAHALGCPALTAFQLATDGFIARWSDPYTSATTLLQASLIARETGLLRLAMHSAETAAAGFQRAGHTSEAVRVLEWAYQQAERTRWPVDMGRIMNRVAYLLLELGEIKRSRILFLSVLERIGGRSSGIAALAHAGLAGTMLAAGAHAEANAALENARGLFTKQPSGPQSAELLLACVRYFARANHADTVRAWLEEGIAAANIQASPALDVDIALARAALHQHHEVPAPDGMTLPTPVLHYLEQALTAGQALSRWKPGKDLLSNLARNWTAAGDFIRARSYFEQARDSQALLETEAGRRRLMVLTQAIESSHIATNAPPVAPATSVTRSISHLTRIGREITGKLDEESMFVVVYHHLEAMIGARRLLAWRCDADTDALKHCFSASAAGVPETDAITEQLDAAVKQCVRDRSELEIYGNGRKSDVHERLYAVVLPMERPGTFLGIMVVQAPNGQGFSDHERLVLRTICEYSSIALGTMQEARKIANLENTVLAAEKQLMESEKLAVLGDLTAGVAHEINNPANFAYAGVHQLASELEAFRDFLLTLAGDDVDPDVSATLNSRMDQLASQLMLVAEGATRIKQVAADLGAFARKGRGTPQLATVGEALHSTVNLVKTQYGEDIEFVCTLQADPAIECDISQLNQVFMNLIVNGCHAIKQRKSSEASPFQGRLQIDTRILDKWLVVSFVDNGCGIPSPQLGRIFERYYTTKSEGKGTGLGLSISQNIIHKHRGRIEVDSVVGRGTTFSLYFPIP